MRLLLLLAIACRPVPDDTDGDDTDPGDGDDADHDGSTYDVDCDDSDPSVYPGADEACDGQDNDCDGDAAHGESDSDGDGLMDCVRCDAAGFWLATNKLDDPVQIRAAMDAVSQPTTCTYAAATDYMFLRLDNEDSEVECVYTGRRAVAITDRPPDMNTEHTWPQSQGAEVDPARCDLHHLYPTDVTANSQRANYPFDEVVSNITWSNGGSMLGSNAGGMTTFEPRDEHKGNVARSMLYFAWRYDKTLAASQIARFQEWHELDPVDAAEWDRTEEIGTQQGDENPFVACIGLAERAW